MSRLPGLCGPVAWAVEQVGELGEGGKALLRPPTPRTPGAFQESVSWSSPETVT